MQEKKNRLKGWHFASSATLICLVINIFVYSCAFDDTHQLVLRDYTMYLQQEFRAGTTRWCRVQIFTCCNCSTGSLYQYIVI